METHLTIDFFDDVLLGEGEWDEAALRRLVREVAARNVTAIHWIGHGRLDDGMWDADSYFDRNGMAGRLRKRLPRARPVLVDEAHRCGVKVWDVLKPFDLAFGLPYASYPPGAGPHSPVGLPQVGAVGSAAIRWLRENPHYRMRIHPALEAPPETVQSPIHAIRLWNRDAQRPEMSGCSIYVSDDNTGYRPLSGAVGIRTLQARRRVPHYAPGGVLPPGPEIECAGVEIGPLRIREPFVAIRVEGRSGIVNTLVALAEVVDDRGRAVPYSYGFTPVQPYGGRDLDWRQHGISFDTARSTGLPRGQLPSLMCCELAVDEVPCLGFARGRNRYLTAPLELSVPGALESVLAMVDAAIADGVDGVDMRLSTHTETLDVENYGFNPETIERYRRRYGQDPVGTGFDRACWQRIRTEPLTALLRRAGERLRAAGQQAAFHVDSKQDPRAGEPGYLGYEWPWREWAAEGLFDSLTAKQFPVDGEGSTELVKRAHAGGMAAWANRKPPLENREEGWIELMARARETGFDAFNIYECANLIRLRKDGSLDFSFPRLWERVRKGA